VKCKLAYRDMHPAGRECVLLGWILAELPIFVALGAGPIPAAVVPLIGKTHRNPALSVPLAVRKANYLPALHQNSARLRHVRLGASLGLPCRTQRLIARTRKLHVSKNIRTKDGLGPGRLVCPWLCLIASLFWAPMSPMPRANAPAMDAARRKASSNFCRPVPRSRAWRRRTRSVDPCARS
jgi:hypothetical protein